MCCRFPLLAALIVLLVSSYTNNLSAIIINVPADHAFIQGAIDDAINGDEIIVAPGTYFETINFNGKAITVRSVTGNFNDTTIDGSGYFHVVKCISDEDSSCVLQGFTVTGGNSNGINQDSRGGGLHIDGSSPTIRYCMIRDNNASNGGGLWNNNSSPKIEYCTFKNNNSQNHGGAVYNNDQSYPEFLHCQFTENTARVHGGAIWHLPPIINSGYYVVANCIFRNNSANNGGGGGIANNYSNARISKCVFLGNNCESRGGGISNWGVGSPVFTNCLFSGNVAWNGGGIRNGAGSTPTISNCTIALNSAVGGGGMYNDNSDVVVLNAIFWNNVDSSGMDESAQILNSGGAGINDPEVYYSNIMGGWTGLGNNNIDLNPNFIDADGPDNIPGTDDDDFRLRAGSPAIDAGVSTSVHTDLDGNVRPVDDPATPDTGLGFPEVADMGAYEYDTDSDGDGVLDGSDVCPGHDDTLDNDSDGLPNGCDICPSDPANDADGDGICGNVDDCPNDVANDADKDGVCGDVDNCPGFDDNLDSDSDGIPDDCDTCPDIFDPNQEDLDQDGVGDICEDPYEYDNTYESATSIPADDTVQIHSIDPQGDEDWYIFSIAQLTTITVQLDDFVGPLKMEIFYDDGESLIKEHADEDELATHVVLDAGTYYVKVACTDPQLIIDQYSISVAANIASANLRFDECTVRAGRVRGKDSFMISGGLDWSLANLNDSSNVNITILNREGLIIDSATFPIFTGASGNEKYTYRNGNYTYSGSKNNSKLSFKFSEDKGTFHYVIRNASLAGLNQPFDVEIETDQLLAMGKADELVINGPKKTMPIQFLNGYQNYLAINSYKMKIGHKNQYDDTLILSGYIATENFVDLTIMPIEFVWENYTVSLPANNFVQKTGKQIFKYSKGRGQNSEISMALFDLEKSKFKLLIKGADFNGNSDFLTSVGNNNTISTTLRFIDFDETINATINGIITNQSNTSIRGN